MYMGLNLQTVPAKFWPPTLLREIWNPHVKNKLRPFQIKNLKEMFWPCDTREDQKQKIRALDFGGSSKSVTIVNYDGKCH